MTRSDASDCDVVIVGSGPAGVSAAFPLLDAGLRVVLVDGGRDVQVPALGGPFLERRLADARQWEWMVGRDFHALRQLDAVSPKFRVPAHAPVFDGFASANRIVSKDFVAVGSLATGGLSNAWGCGVACLSAEELASFPLGATEMRDSYRSVAMRIGISGGAGDDLSEFFGLDAWSQAPLAMDELQGGLFRRYMRGAGRTRRHGLRLGRARMATLSAAMGDRLSCDLSGNCLWGCQRRALYCSTEDLRALQCRPGFVYRPGFIVEDVAWDGSRAGVHGRTALGRERLHGRRVVLAAGTLASTRLALSAIDHRAAVPMQSCPTAAFLLWLPMHLGRARQAAFGLGQLAFALDLPSLGEAYGALFSTTGIPLGEFARFLPVGRRSALDVLEPLLASCIVGNVFLPGSLMDATLQLDAQGSLQVSGRFRDEVAGLMDDVRRRLAASFRALGAILLPGSFRLGRPGSDIHYAASLPMCMSPHVGQTDAFGALVGAPGIHVVDGASLPFLPAKPHTLTIMANADRIGRHVADLLSRRCGNRGSNDGIPACSL